METAFVKENQKISQKIKRNECFGVSTIQTFRYKTYPIDVMSLSHAERSESYPIEKSYCKYSFQMETDALSDILFKTIHNYRCVLS